MWVDVEVYANSLTEAIAAGQGIKLDDLVKLAPGAELNDRSWSVVGVTKGSDFPDVRQ